MMTNYFSRVKFFVIGFIFLTNAAMASAKPMDVEAAKKLPELERILKNVREKGNLSDEDRKIISGNLVSGDPVLVSLSGYILGLSKDDESELCTKSEIVLNNTEPMPEAFLLIGLTKNRVKGKNVDEKAAMYEILFKTKNPYLRVLSAKELSKIDSPKGVAAFRALLSDDSPVSKYEASRYLEKSGKGTNVSTAPLADERYELLLTIIEK